MLAELRIRDLAIIEELHLAFEPGFNVLTGETGAGKSIIIDAVGLLLGDRASQEILRAGADRTEVEGTFILDPAAQVRLGELLAENGLEGDQADVLMLAREVRANGRSVARVNGRAVATTLLGEIGQHLVDIHGQGEHLSLLREREHIRLLDRYAGLEAQGAAMAELVRRLRQTRRELESLRQDERERAQRIDLLTYQVAEIEAARLQPDEMDELEAERRRLANAEQLALLGAEVVQLLQEGSAEQLGVLDALGTAEQALSRLARIDPDTSALAEQLTEATALLSDLSLEMSRYCDQIEFNPQRLEQVEERLQLIQSLRRKYGDTVEDVLAYAVQAAAELDTITHAEERIGELEAQETTLLQEVGRLGCELSAARAAAGVRMAQAIEDELADLQMAKAQFAVNITWTPDPTGAIVDDTCQLADVDGREDSAGDRGKPGRYVFDSHGLDHVAFLVSANPGEPLRPMAKVASGGETSRLMLALKTVLGRADETPSLIFDEIDVGIGGRIGATVGRKLWELTAGPRGDEAARRSEKPSRRRSGGGVAPTRELAPAAPLAETRHQVLCITHLPQLAAYGDAHFHVAKRLEAQRTVTSVMTLTGVERVAELARMMGADSEAGRTSVSEVLAEVERIKRQA